MNYRFAAPGYARKGRFWLGPALVVGLGLLSSNVAFARPSRTRPTVSRPTAAPAAPATRAPSAGAGPGVQPARAPSAGAAPGIQSTPVPPPAPAQTAPAQQPAPATPVPTPGAEGVTSGTTVDPATTSTAVDGGEAAPESATTGVAVVPPETPTEQEAAGLAENAMARDFKAGRYKFAERKLRQALSLCLKDGCSAPFRARLNRDLGVVYVSGLRRIEDGKDEFATALTTDPTVAIAVYHNTRSVNDAFLEVKRAIQSEATGRPPAASARGAAKKPTKRGKASTPSEAPSDSAAASNWRNVRNWFSIGVQQDFMLHSSTQNVCNTGSRYACFDGTGTAKNFDQGGIDNGNEISASGLRLASTRLLIGFDRLLSKNFALGIRVGGVISGVARRLSTDPQPFFRFHGEARLTLYPGSDPFSPTRHVRPYLFGSGGLAETDSKIPVDVVQGGATGRLDAWKRSGKTFIGGGLGLSFPISQGSGPFIEARFQRMFDKPAFVGAAMFGYGLGF